MSARSPDSPATAETMMAGKIRQEQIALTMKMAPSPDRANGGGFPDLFKGKGSSSPCSPLPPSSAPASNRRAPSVRNQSRHDVFDRTQHSFGALLHSGAEFFLDRDLLTSLPLRPTTPLLSATRPQDLLSLIGLSLPLGKWSAFSKRYSSSSTASVRQLSWFLARITFAYSLLNCSFPCLPL